MPVHLFPSVFHLVACQSTPERGFVGVWPSQPPLSSFDQTVKRVLSGSPPYFVVGDPLLPLDVEYISQISVCKGLLFVCKGLDGAPGLTGI